MIHEVVQRDYSLDYRDDRLICEGDYDQWALMAAWVSEVREISDQQTLARLIVEDLLVSWAVSVDLEEAVYHHFSSASPDYRCIFPNFGLHHHHGDPYLDVEVRLELYDALPILHPFPCPLEVRCLFFDHRLLLPQPLTSTLTNSALQLHPAFLSSCRTS
jgi:hypothetical protein